MNTLKIGVGARPLSMGGSYTAVADDVYSIYWNPAGLIHIEKAEVSLCHNRWLEDIVYNWIGYTYPVSHEKNRTFGISLGYLYSGEMTRYIEKMEFPFYEKRGVFDAKDIILSLSYAQLLGVKNESVPFGINFKVLQEQLENYKATGFAFDIGLKYRSLSSLSVTTYAFVLKNIGFMGKFETENDPLPFMIDLGISHLIKNYSTVFALDVRSPIDNKAVFSLGAEYRYYFISLRTGYRFGLDLSDITCGAGLNYEGLNLDYAYLPYDKMGNVHYFSLSFKFGASRRKKTKGKFISPVKLVKKAIGSRQTIKEGKGKEKIIRKKKTEYLNLKRAVIDVSSEKKSSYSVSKLIDNRRKTYWRSALPAGQWVKMNFQFLAEVSGIVIYWGEEFPEAFNIELSEDGISWRTVYSSDDCEGGVEDINISKTECVLMRLSFKDAANGVSIKELKVKGIKKSGKLKSGKIHRPVKKKKKEVKVQKDKRAVKVKKQTNKKVEIKKRPIKKFKPEKVTVTKSKLIDDFSSLQKWFSGGADKTEIKLNSPVKNELVADYSLENGDWVYLVKWSDIPVILNKSEMIFDLKTEGAVNNVKIKLVDKKYNSFVWKQDGLNLKKYKTFKLKPEDFTESIGSKTKPDDIIEIEITISKKTGGRGKLYIRNLRYRILTFDIY